jgi:hypothetical protein
MDGMGKSGLDFEEGLDNCFDDNENELEELLKMVGIGM